MQTKSNCYLKTDYQHKNWSETQYALRPKRWNHCTDSKVNFKIQNGKKKLVLILILIFYFQNDLFANGFVWGSSLGNMKDTQICHLLFFDSYLFLFRKQKLQVYFSFWLRDFTHLFLYYPAGLGNQVNGFKLFYLEAIPSGNEGGLSQLATQIPASSSRAAVYSPVMPSCLVFPQHRVFFLCCWGCLS